MRLSIDCSPEERCQILQAVFLAGGTVFLPEGFAQPLGPALAKVCREWCEEQDRLQAAAAPTHEIGGEA